ncbi:hypothetical protein FRC10_012327 [Ceratobasidium sp. 414]|nr:hypothetical protein FRC10_012327 [Ceratobasidium sp. 414]
MEHNFKIGRGRGNDFTLAGHGISSEHCTIALMLSAHADERLTKDNIYVFVEDHSRNGTYINTELIGKGHKTRLSVGDELFLSSGKGADGSENLGGWKGYIFRLPPDAPSADDGVLAKYDLGSSLGQGAFGAVCRALCRTTGKWFACKIVSKSRFAHSPKKLQMVQREVAILRNLDHSRSSGWEIGP